MENIETFGLDIFLNENFINYKKTYEEPHGYKENGYIRYYLYQNHNNDRHYSIDIKNSKLITFEYESEKHNYVSTVLFEEVNEWNNVDKKELFRIILQHMTMNVESDNDD
jgi:hypothetical protein